ALRPSARPLYARSTSSRRPRDPPAEYMPVEMEDGLARALADVDGDAIVVQACDPCRLRDELEHPLRLVGRKLTDLAEARDVPLREDEKVRLGRRVDVTDRDKPLAAVDVVAFPDETAKEAVVRQRGCPPRSLRPRGRSRWRRPDR